MVNKNQIGPDEWQGDVYSSLASVIDVAAVPSYSQLYKKDLFREVRVGEHR